MVATRFDDARRLETLRDYRVLDSAPELSFDNVTRLATALFHTPIALVSLVDEHRQWFKSRVGLEVAETPREWSFCDHAVRADSDLVVEDASRDPRFADNPLVTGEPGIRFYCGVVLHASDGQGLGTLCLIDRVPRTISREERASLEVLARQVEAELELRRRVALLEEALEQERGRQDGQALLASMLVHDLRGPLTSISILADSLEPTEASRGDLEDLKLEGHRARHMLTDVLDVCLGQLGQLRPRRALVELSALLGEVGRRLAARGRSRGQRVEVEVPDEPLEVDADPELIERVLENLLANAMDHGPPDRTITVAGRHAGAGRVRLEVRDEGEPVAPELREAIFLPFESHPAEQSAAGGRHHGLGLAFCGMVARAHGGMAGVEPGRGGGNCFFVELPLAGA